MTLTSDLKTAEDALLSILVAASPGGLVPTLGDPGAQIANDAVWIAEDVSATWTPDLSSGSGPGPVMTEEFELSVKILVVRLGDDFAAVRDRSSVLSEAVETAVAANRTLGGTIDDCYVTSIERNAGASDTGRIMETSVQIHAWSYLA